MSSLCWVFGYGSLMWDPGFHVAEQITARLDGYARSFCLRSTRYRGTAEAPGLVLGLDEDPAAHCTGIALRFAEEDRDAVLAYLRDRELVTHAYREAILPIALADGRRVEALTYVMRRDHVQYAGGLPPVSRRASSRARGGRTVPMPITCSTPPAIWPSSACPMPRWRPCPRMSGGCWPNSRKRTGARSINLGLSACLASQGPAPTLIRDRRKAK